MIELNLFLLQFCAHLLADFVFQPQKMSDKKSRKIFSTYHLRHFLIVGIFSYLLAFDLGFWSAALLIAFLHMIIDILKSWLILKFKGKNYFFADQLIHIIAILLVTYLFSSLVGLNQYLEFSMKTIAIFTGIIFCTKPSNIIIKYLFVAFDIKTPDEDRNKKEELSLPNAGKLIGIAERLIALALVIPGQYEALGLIIAAKSILRFNATPKSEYVLVGTLLSFGIAVFCGILINSI
ncbi:MAG: hypothetical protein FD181_2504 [Prolixibacteraceae bacterium]|nr:MAG: hypothetical protein FD181_2504 [Prolixibacteraceae bacterium]